MTSPLDGFLDFAPLVMIPSRDKGVVPFWPLLPSQRFLLDEFERGIREHVHDFTVLKGGRQSTVGGSTLLDALSLFYLQTHSGLVGMMVSDEDDNRDYRRDVMLSMLDSLPKSHRQPVRRDNRAMLAWTDNPGGEYYGSRLLFASAGKRADSNLGRSKGINFNYNDEFGFWYQQRAYGALRASRSEVHPLRLYVDISTANGIGSLMHHEWKIASKAVTRRAIFVSCWRNQDAGCRIAADDPEGRWERYGADDLSEQERAWTREVLRRYGVTLTREFFAWYRWKLAEQMGGDETLMAQEYGVLPEECFQAFGDKFIPAGVVSRLRRDVAHAPEPREYRYDFPTNHMEDTKVTQDDSGQAPLRVWADPHPEGLYVVAAHPWGSSSPHAKLFCCEVWRAWPDRMALVAEFASPDIQMAQFAWVCMHLAGAYKTWAPAYFILEVGGPGQHVLMEIERIETLGYGVAADGFGRREKISNVLGAIRHYVYRRPDSFRNTTLKQMKATGQIRSTLFYGLRSEVERDHLLIPSVDLIDQLAGLRRGEEGDADTITGGAGQDDSRPYTAALAVTMWLEMAMHDLLTVVPPSSPQPGQPTHAGEEMVMDFMARLRATGGA